MPPPVYYGDYLQLDRLLSAQAPESAKHGPAAHDEMLFILVHQAYELWFKQILHELDRVERDFSADPVGDEALARITHSLARILAILKLIVGQIDVLETMTPSDFLEFRDRLMPASGFQSAQFRMIEARLGLDEARRTPVAGQTLEDRLSPADRARLAAARARPSLHALADRWLARTPFLDWGQASFGEAYRAAVRAHLTSDADRLAADPGLDPAGAAEQRAALDKALRSFEAIFSPGESGGWRLSPPAVQAALFIVLYREMPALQQPFRLLALLMDIDEGLSLWRTRHALMVERMIGVKIGTGGSSGHAYLRMTTERHRVFGDLFRLSTFLIPRSAVPALPAEVKARMGLVYAAHEGARPRPERSEEPGPAPGLASGSPGHAS
jgi:tryptophan 2,3-dioxygenase